MHLQTKLICSKTPLISFFARVGYMKKPTHHVVCFYMICTAKWWKISTLCVRRLPTSQQDHINTSTHTHLHLHHMSVHLLSLELAYVWIPFLNINCKTSCFSRISLFRIFLFILIVTFAQASADYCRCCLRQCVETVLNICSLRTSL